ncbi:hypothetical protein SAMN05421820_101435 [Pedobacter steynii]|uniref:Molybdopterin-guanine dinucleotide biosynthesis protein MobB n=1 Tax=Pedobacter steynii TaxID=430522 RepID=A0A1G9K0P4_9SPHI|nr:DUF5712 family protein [Pedobacter steynii]NQX38415.1 molybdopterin-guanine dinucleotide biosynthesis protein MobB [Pedobacter steynii]SDL43500.1 hypothetical protein SAMN05421820_101435 [Pedobacter steynii]
MFLNITDSEKKDKGGNRGSCGELVHYLEKENRIYKLLNPEQWFNGIGSGYAPYEVRNRIDENKAKLCKNEAKFFLLNISPSQKEIAHLKKMYGEQGAKDQLKSYAIKIMDEYARNFKRAKVNDNRNLLWFAKLENHRYYRHNDKEVKNGTAKRGDLKPGEQMHIQVIVSRKDITDKIKLSPGTNHDGHNKKISSKMGEFNRVAFKNSGEQVFDEMFDFSRPLTDTFRYANTLANGGLAEKLALREEKGKMDQASRDLGLELKSLVKMDVNTSTLLEVLLAKPDFDPVPALKKKKKRKKGAQQQSELSF